MRISIPADEVAGGVPLAQAFDLSRRTRRPPAKIAALLPGERTKHGVRE